MAKPIGLNNPVEFQYDDESRSTASTRWTVWIRDFELFLAGSGISDGAQKKAILLHVVGSAAREIYYTKAYDNDDYAAVKKTLLSHFTPLKNLDFEVFQFTQLRQREAESIDDFVVRMRVAATRCEFGDEDVTDAKIKRQLIVG